MLNSMNQFEFNKKDGEFGSVNFNGKKINLLAPPSISDDGETYEAIGIIEDAHRDALRTHVVKWDIKACSYEDENLEDYVDFDSPVCGWTHCTVVEL